MTKEYLEIYDDLHLRSKSSVKKIRIEASREYDLFRKCCYSSKYLFYKNNKHKGKLLVNSFVLLRGQILTTYNELAKLWGCTYNTARAQILKWIEKGIIEKLKIKDSANKDLGIIISYKKITQKTAKKVSVSNTGYTTPGEPQPQGVKKLFCPPLKYSLLTKVNKKKTNKKDFVSSVVSSDKISKIKKPKKKYEFESDKNFIEISDKLKELKFSKKLIEKLYKSYSQDQIKAHIEHLELKMQNGIIRNPRGFLIASIQSKFDLSELVVHRANKQQEKKEQKKLEEMRMEQEKQRQKEIIEFEKKQESENKKLELAVQNNPELIDSILKKSSENKLLRDKKITIEELLNPKKLEHFVFVDFVNNELKES